MLKMLLLNLVTALSPLKGHDLCYIRSRGERILIFQLLIHIRKIFAYPYPILIRNFQKISIRYPPVSECNTN